jgi:hypothetical protein
MDNTADSLYLDLWMAYPQTLSGIYPVDPIDSLQTLFNIWKTTVSTNDSHPAIHDQVKIFTDQSGITSFDFSGCRNYLNQRLVIFDITGRIKKEMMVTERIIRIAMGDLSYPQILGYRLISPENGVTISGKFLR